MASEKQMDVYQGSIPIGLFIPMTSDTLVSCSLFLDVPSYQNRYYTLATFMLVISNGWLQYALILIHVQESGYMVWSLLISRVVADYSQ